MEIVTDSTGTHNRYQISAYGRSVAMVDLEAGSGSTPTMNVQYLLTDHLGSVDVATNTSGALIAGTGWSFDAFGSRRNPSTWLTPNAASQTSTDRSSVTHRGYTGHEMLDALGFIHMNGRVYNPTLGRFLSVDPVFQFPTNTQSLNPYSYVLNNPLSMTDPTGYVPECFWNYQCDIDGNRIGLFGETDSHSRSGSYRSNGHTAGQRSDSAQRTDRNSSEIGSPSKD